MLYNLVEGRDEPRLVRAELEELSERQRGRVKRMREATGVAAQQGQGKGRGSILYSLQPLHRRRVAAATRTHTHLIKL